MSYNKLTFAKIIQENKFLIMPKTTSLAEKLKELRQRADLPQRKIAAVLDVDTATYCKFEKGVLRISREQLIKFSNFLNIEKKPMLALWLADQMKKTVSKESKDIANEAIEIVSQSIH